MVNDINDLLTHFTDANGFKGIIKSKKFWPKYNPEEITHEMKTWYSDDDILFNPLYIPMVCFCDSDINTKEHIKTYNGFGISFTKDWAVRKGLSPVMYIHRRSMITSKLHELFIRNAIKYSKRENILEDHNLLFWISLFTKPYQGYFSKTGKEEVFYLEREWRYVPKLSKNQVEYSNLEPILKSRNESVKQYSIEFEYNEIQSIILQRNKQEEIVAFFEESSLNDLVNKISFID